MVSLVFGLYLSLWVLEDLIFALILLALLLLLLFQLQCISLIT